MPARSDEERRDRDGARLLKLRTALSSLARTTSQYLLDPAVEAPHCCRYTTPAPRVCHYLLKPKLPPLCSDDLGTACRARRDVCSADQQLAASRPPGWRGRYGKYAQAKHLFRTLLRYVHHISNLSSHASAPNDQSGSGYADHPFKPYVVHRPGWRESRVHCRLRY